MMLSLGPAAPLVVKQNRFDLDSRPSIWTLAKHAEWASMVGWEALRSTE